jgi:hypothetical protein
MRKALTAVVGRFDKVFVTWVALTLALILPAAQWQRLMSAEGVQGGMGAVPHTVPRFSTVLGIAMEGVPALALAAHHKVVVPTSGAAGLWAALSHPEPSAFLQSGVWMAGITLAIVASSVLSSWDSSRRCSCWA